MPAKTSEPFFIPTLAVIGVGLIGGSLAAALKKSRSAGKVIGVGRKRENLEIARRMGIVDEIEQDIAKAVASADVILLATPVCSTGKLLATIREHLLPSAIITDVGSIKQEVLSAAQRELGDTFPRFIPGHPIAGAENSGAAAANADLFIDRKVVLTPAPETSLEALETIRRMWLQAGAELSEMPAQSHDEIFAATSHLPHILAYTLVSYLLHSDNGRGFFEYAAGGFADFTRIASSDPSMWRDICLCNREALTEAIDGFEQALAGLKQMIRQGDESGLHDLFEEAKSHRDEWLEKRQ